MSQPVDNDRVTYTSFLRRTTAYSVDSLLVTAPLVAAGIWWFLQVLPQVGPAMANPFVLMVVLATSAAEHFGLFVAIALYCVIGIPLYYTVPLARGGATPGKWFIGARVVDARTLGPVTLRQAVTRFGVSTFLSWLLWYLPLLWVAFDRRKQALHDKAAGTVVIDLR